MQRQHIYSVTVPKGQNWQTFSGWGTKKAPASHSEYTFSTDVHLTARSKPNGINNKGGVDIVAITRCSDEGALPAILYLWGGMYSRE